MGGASRRQPSAQGFSPWAAHRPTTVSRSVPISHTLLLALTLCLALTAPPPPPMTKQPRWRGANQYRQPHPPRRPPARLPTGTVYLARTGHYLRGAFRDFWLTNGGAAQFGYPLSEEYVARGADGVRRTTQLFDRARFELHDDGSGNWFVALGHLGREALGGQSFPSVPAFVPTDERAYIAATGHSLANGFLGYWLANEGERYLGYPLSEELSVSGRVMQHFERGRLEYHPATGALGPVALGQELLVARGWPRPTRISLTLSLPAPGQGQTTIAELFADRPLTVVSARLDDRPLTFFGSDIYYRAFIGLGPDIPVGTHTLSLQVRDADGIKPLTLSLPVREPPSRGPGLPAARPGGTARPRRRRARVADCHAALRDLHARPKLERTLHHARAGAITTEFGEVRAYNDGPFNSWHNGLDIGAPQGAPLSPRAGSRGLHRHAADPGQLHRDRPRARHPHLLLPPVRNFGRRRPDGANRRPDRPCRHHRPLHRRAPPLGSPRRRHPRQPLAMGARRGSAVTTGETANGRTGEVRWEPPRRQGAAKRAKRGND